jgi:L-cysteine desulfidase
VEETIRNVGRLGRVGMRETDRTILRIMTDQPDPA